MNQSNVIDGDPRIADAILQYLEAEESGTPIAEETWLSLHPSEIQVALREFLANRAIVAMAADSLAPSAQQIEPFGFYRDFAFLAEGGMGTIFRCKDSRLERPVAMKVLHRRLMALADMPARFREEAQVAGQLQHPNIAPVHELGELADGRPYFTMKLVEGNTFSVSICEYHANKSDERFEKLLRDFVSICEGVEYAHSRGVLHRDLKPANVMVGRFGEVLVMDWGLTKVLAAPNEGTEPHVHTARSDDPHGESQPGVRGTPAFMPPEQANGSVKLDGRCDVFALGAILCQILTGKPAYTSDKPDIRELIDMARRGATTVAFQRLDASGATRELVDLAKKCMASMPEHRPNSVKNVGDAVTRYQASVQKRVQEAEVGRARAEAEVLGERRKRRWQVGAVVVVLLAASGAIAGAAWYKLDRDAREKEEQVRERTKQQSREVLSADLIAAVDDVYSSLNQDQFAAGRAALERAKGRLGPTPQADLSELVSTAIRNFEAVLALDEIRQERVFRTIQSDLGSVFTTFRVKSVAPVLTKYAKQFVALGYDPASPDVGARVRSSPIRRVLLTVLDDWATHEPDLKMQLQLWAVAREADPDPGWGERFRDPAIRKDPAKLAALAADASPDQLTLGQIEALVEALPDLNPDALRLLRAAEVRYPNDFWVNIANVRRLVNTPAGSLEAARFLRRETIGYARTAAAIRPDSFLALIAMGHIYARENNTEEVEKIAHRLPQSGRMSWMKSYMLAMAASGRRKHQEAIRHMSHALELDPGGAVIKLELAKCYFSVGDHEKGLSLVDELLASDPENTSAMAAKAVAFLTSGRLDEAMKLGRAALERVPTNLQAREVFALLLLRQGRLLDLEAYLEALDPEERERGGGALGAGMCLYFRGDLKEAERVLRRAEELTPSIDIELVLCFVLVAGGRFAEAKSMLDTVRLSLREIDYSQFALLGITLKLAISNGDIHLKNFIECDAKWGKKPPRSVNEEFAAGIPALFIPAADYCLAKRYYVPAARCYALALPENSWHGGMNYVVIIPGTNRIKAARAAVQAWGNAPPVPPGVRPLIDHERFRTLALRWLKEEVDNCIQVAATKGSKEDVNLRIHMLKMHPELDLVRNPALIRAMPEADRKHAEEIWAGVEELYRKLNPPLDIPWAKKKPMQMK